MTCPHCGDKFTLISALKLRLLLKLPDSYFQWRERRELLKMKRKVVAAFENKRPPKGRHSLRVESMAIDYANGDSLETIAKTYNVTRERVRQCVAKFVRTEANHEKP